MGQLDAALPACLQQEEAASDPRFITLIKRGMIYDQPACGEAAICQEKALLEVRRPVRSP